MPNEMSGIEIKGISACLPDSSGLPDGVCASDLCCAAGRNLLEALGWEPDTIGLLINVTQTPDSPNHPITAPYLASTLGLGEIMALDVPGGGAGFVLGLQVACSLLGVGAFNRALLCAGDALSQTLPKDCDPAAAALGDSGTVTALEKTGAETSFSFNTVTIGKEFDVNITPGLGFRKGFNLNALEIKESANGGKLRDVDPNIDLKRMRALAKAFAPSIVAESQPESVDEIFFTEIDCDLHREISEGLGLNVFDGDVFERYGNLESASLPVAIVESFSKDHTNSPKRMLLVGYGSGFTCAAVTCDVSDLTVLKKVWK